MTKCAFTSFLAIAAACSFAVVSPAVAQSVATDPVGFTTTSLLGNSDSYISVPFVRPAAFVGGIQSSGGTNITVSGNPWTANQFVYAPGSQPNYYYALIGPASSANPKEGRTYPILSNTTNTITVDLGADNLTGLPANAQLSIIPNWSLATVFPASDANVSFTPTTSVPTYKTQIRVPDTSTPGTNLPHRTYYFGNSAWRLLGDAATDRGDDPLLPDSYFAVRNLNGAPTLPLVTLGAVLLKKVTLPLSTNTTGAQDNPVGLLRPLDVSLNATGLDLSDGSFVAGDELHLFNNSVAGYDKAPRVYVRNPSAANARWTWAADPMNDRGNEIIPAGTGFLIRKASTADGQAAYWTNSFPVQAVSAVSRLTHGAAGVFDLNLPLSGTPAVESRNAPGGAYRIVFTFPKPVTFAGAVVTSGVATSATPSNLATDVVAVDVSGVTDVQRITVTLLGVNDGSNANDVAVRMAILVGDVNGNSNVNAADVGQTKAFSGGAVSQSNFRADVNASGGTINASDIAFVKSKSGGFLPPDTTTEPAKKEQPIALAGSER
ncbi:hypothetical protein BH20VER2_BH20VER2_15390 [soil metagenome]|nr:TIGR02597 family protein [Chthoniobacterales bacterium]